MIATLATLPLLVGPGLVPPSPRHGGAYPPPGFQHVEGPPPPGPLPGSGPGTPGTSDPSTPRPGGPGTEGGGGTDPTDWRLWWALNRHGYIDLRTNLFEGAVETGSDDFLLGRGGTDGSRADRRPSRELVAADVVPALLFELEGATDPDLVTAMMMALGKIGPTDAPGASAGALVAALRPRLAHASQEVSETTAIALGLVGGRDAFTTLVDVLLETERGLKLVRKGEVPIRTRAFAAYGLGLIGSRSDDNVVRQRVAEVLVRVLEGPNQSSADVKIAAVTGLGLTPVDIAGTVPRPDSGRPFAAEAPHVVSRRTQLAYLASYFVYDRREAKSRPRLVRAHAAVALGRLLEGAPKAVKATIVPGLLDAVRPRSREPQEVQEAVVLALGRIGDADSDGVDVAIREALVRLVVEGTPMSRRFALVSLAAVAARPGEGEEALVGTADVRALLLSQLGRGKARMRPWAALALGVLGHRLDRGRIPMDESAGRAVLLATKACRTPIDIGAYALALGLRRRADAGDTLLEKLDRIDVWKAQGELAIALGMAGERAAREPIRELVLGSKYRAELLVDSATGLGLLGEENVVPILVDALRGARSLASQATAAEGLRAVGDSRAVAPLLDLLADDGTTTQARAYAAVALGGVCEPTPLPWKAAIAEGAPYTALVTTLTGGGKGLLDIL